MQIPLSLTFKNGKLFYSEDLEHEQNPKPIKGPIIGPESVKLRETSKYVSTLHHPA